ncbi:MAG: WD40 repeat domain-containing protein [Planctomycetaceae bacterium]|nr:WD40 repeat domain-containing protein [Planctomycetaceae bacterium]
MHRLGKYILTLWAAAAAALCWGCGKTPPAPEKPAPSSQPAVATSRAAAPSSASAPAAQSASVPASQAAATTQDEAARQFAAARLAQSRSETEAQRQRSISATQAAAEKARTDALLRREQARTALAYREAYEFWQQAQQLQAEAAEAFDKAEFPAADQKWSAAAEIYPKAVQLAASLTQARQHLAALRYPDAAAAAVAALKIDPACRSAVALQEDIRIAGGAKAVDPDRTRAESAVSAAMGLSDGDGFASLQIDLRRQLSRAHGLAAQTQFDQAIEAYKAIVARCEQLKTRDAARQAVAPLKAAAESARQRTASLDLVRDDPAQWQKALDSAAAAAEAMAKGDFDAAKQHYSAAAAAYDKGAVIAAALQAARKNIQDKKFAEAQKAAQAVLTADAANAAARALLVETVETDARDAAVTAQAAARGALSGVSSLDDAQGFSQLKNAAAARLATAEGLLARRKYEPAFKEFQAVSAECPRIKTLDVARQAMVRTRETLAAQQQTVLSAGANHYAPARWKQAQGRFDEGERAFHSGDFDAAKTAWTAATTDLQAAAAVVARMAAVRQAAAEGRFPEAAKAAAELMISENQSEPTKALVEEVRLATLKAAAAAPRAAAQAAVKALSDIDENQTFDELKRRLRKQLRAAETLFDQNRYEDLPAAYKAVADECTRIRTLDAKRKTLLATRQAVQAVWQQALGAGAECLAPQQWPQLQNDLAAGEDAFAKGDMDAAAKAWAAVAPRGDEIAKLTAAMAQGQAHLSAGRPAEAQKSFEAALAVDAANAAARQGRQDAVRALARQGLLTTRAKVDAAIDAAALDAPEFDALKQKTFSQAQLADALLDKDDLEKAAAAYDAVLAQCKQVADLLPPRSAADQVRAAMAASRQTALSAGAHWAAAAPWAAAQQAAAQGQQAFDAGDFVAAAAQWKTAQAQYAQAAADAPKRQKDPKVTTELAQAARTAMGAAAGKAGAAQQDAPALWQQAQELSASGGQALQGGDSSAAQARWIAATAIYEKGASAAAAVTAARTALAAKKYPEAVAAARGAIGQDVDNAAARQLIRDASLEAARAETTIIKTRAESDAAAVVSLDDNQGFAVLKAAVVQLNSAAASAWGSNAIYKSQRLYRQIVSQAAQVKASDARRQDAAKLRVQAAASQQKAMPAASDAASLVQQGAQESAAAEKLFQAGDFDSAAACWKLAAASYDAVPAAAAKIQDARKQIQAKNVAAAEALRAILVGAPGNDAARQLLREARQAADGESLAKIAAATGPVITEVNALNDSQGFAPLKARVAATLQAASDAQTRSEFDEAGAQYDKAITLCQAIKKLDAQRTEAAKLKAAASARIQELPQKTQADKAAPAAWQRAAAANAAATQLFEQGAFNEATALWADFATACTRAEEIAAVLTKATALHAAGKTQEAQVAMIPILAAEPAGAAAQAWQTMETAHRRAAAETLQKQAAAAVLSLAPLAATEGFDSLKQALVQLTSTADSDFAAGRYEQAGAGYDAVVAGRDQIVQLDERRKASLPVKTAADAAAAKISAISDQHNFQPLKQAVTAELTAAGACFSQRAFDDADAHYRAAMKLYEPLARQESLRAELDAVRTQTDALASKAQAVLSPQVPSSWQQTQQFQAAAQQAFTRGDFATARLWWAAAAHAVEEGNAATTLLTAAQQHLAAGKLPEALETIVKARLVACDSSPAQQLETNIRFAIGRLDAQPIIKAAEAAQAASAKVAGEQGVESMKQQIAAKLADARQRLERNEFDNAVAVYREVVVECDVISQIDRRRAASLPLRQKAVAAVAAISSLTDSHGFAALKNEARQQHSAAEALFEQRKFDESDPAHRAAIVMCEKLAALEARRGELAKLQEQAAKTWQDLNVAQVNSSSPQLWQPIEQAYNAGQSAFSAGTFDEAQKQWNDLQARAPAAVKMGQAVIAARTLHGQQKVVEAIASIDAALAIDSRSSVAKQLRDEIGRNELSQTREKLRQQREQVIALEIGRYAPRRWEQYEKALAAGEGAYAKADFDTARSHWKVLVEGYANAPAYVESMKKVYEGVLAWQQARADVATEYYDQFDALGGREWQTIKGLVARAEQDGVEQAERIECYKKAAQAMPAVAAKVENIYRTSVCDKAIAQAKSLLAGIPIKASQRTPEHVARAAMAGEEAARALAQRPNNAQAKELAAQAQVLAVPLKTGSCLRTFGGHKGWILAAAVGPSGDQAATSGEEGDIKIWDLWHGVNSAGWSAHSGPINAVAFGPADTAVLSAGEDAMLKIWDTAAGRNIRTLTGHTACATAVVMAADGRTAMSASEDATLRLWDTATGQCLRTFSGHSGPVGAAAISRDGRTAVSGGADRTVKLWDTADGRCLRTFEGHGAAVTALAISADSRTAISASADKTLKLWDLVDGRCLQTFIGHDAAVLCVALHPDGQRALSGSRDTTLKLWDLATGKCLATFEGHRGWVRSAAFDAEGTTAISADETALKVWFVGKSQTLPPPKAGK